MRFEFQAWLTKPGRFHDKMNNGIPVPMRVMFGNIVKETERGLFIEVWGKPEPSTYCLHCRRKLTHKVSMFYGLGPVCGKHFYIADVSEEEFEARLDEIRKKMAEIRWRGFVPKKAVVITPEEFHTFEFVFQGKTYRVTTSDKTKIKQIREKSDYIISETVTQG